MYTVYMHINKENGKRYIGITSMRPAQRWHNGQGYRHQRRFYNSIQSHGWGGFHHIIVKQGLTKEEAEVAEESLIKKYMSNDLRYGYNIENGGHTNKLTQEQKEHLRKINLGKKYSEETKKKKSESLKGKSTAWLTGRKQSKETIQKRREHWAGANNPRAKRVYQYDLGGNLVGEYSCMEEARKALGVSKSAHISQCCAGKRGKAYGYMWSYKKEDKEPYARKWKGGVIHG